MAAPLFTLSRRQMMKLSAGALLAAGLWPGRVRAAMAPPQTKTLKFIQVNDLHYLTDACAPFFEALVKKFNEMDGVAHVLIVGDLTDNGAAGTNHALHDILKELKVPYHITAGNHDSVSTTSRENFNRIFGENMNYTFEVNGWQFVGLDTSDFQKVEKFDCHKETLDFAAALPGKLDKARPTFVFTHFPLGPEIKYRLQNADALLEPFKQLNVAAIFNGHYHAFTEARVLGGVMVTTDRCCSRARANHDNTREKGFFVIEAEGMTFKRTFVEWGTDWPGGVQVTTQPATTRAAPAGRAGRRGGAGGAGGGGGGGGGGAGDRAGRVCTVIRRQSAVMIAV